MKCPGIDTQFWKPGDIFTIKCPKCDVDLEFFRDDAKRKCPKCGEQYFNPKIKTDCLEYCKYADQCKELLDK
jgi:anaerobic ribonucleoside-triphosphate reductase